MNKSLLVILLYFIGFMVFFVFSAFIEKPRTEKVRILRKELRLNNSISDKTILTVDYSITFALAFIWPIYTISGLIETIRGDNYAKNKTQI